MGGGGYRGGDEPGLRGGHSWLGRELLVHDRPRIDGTGVAGGAGQACERRAPTAGARIGQLPCVVRHGQRQPCREGEGAMREVEGQVSVVGGETGT